MGEWLKGPSVSDPGVCNVGTVVIARVTSGEMGSYGNALET